jgi:hypothetical protein
MQVSVASGRIILCGALAGVWGKKIIELAAQMMNSINFQTKIKVLASECV